MASGSLTIDTLAADAGGNEGILAVPVSFTSNPSRSSGLHHGWCADGHGATSAHLYGDAAVSVLLASHSDDDNFDALIHLLALIVQVHPPPLFLCLLTRIPVNELRACVLAVQAVKNAVVQSLELKTLVLSTSTSACSTTPRS